MNKARPPLPSDTPSHWGNAVDSLLRKRLSGWLSAYLSEQVDDPTLSLICNNENLQDIFSINTTVVDPELLVVTAKALSQQSWMSWRARSGLHHWNPLVQSFHDFQAMFPEPVCYLETAPHNRGVREQQLLGWLVQLTWSSAHHE